MPPVPTSTLAVRHAQLRARMPGRGIDALVVSHLPNLRYLANHGGTAGLAVVTATAVHLLVDFRYLTAIEMLQASPAACPDLRVWNVPGSYEAALAECLASVDVRSAGFEAAHVSVARHGAWIRACGARGASVTLVPTEGAVEAGRVI
jgi:Xaa-Pro aminopeptidase